MKQQEMWQVQVQGQIYESDLKQLKQWVSEGRITENDLVKRGSLRWLAAGKVPSLMKFFNSAGENFHPPVVTTTEPIQNNSVEQTHEVSVQTQGHPNQNFSPNNPKVVSNQTAFEHQTTPQNQPTNEFLPSTTLLYCNFHRERFPEFICNTCTNLFCRECTEKSVDGNVKCSVCGSDCNVFEPLEEDLQQIQTQIYPQSNYETGEKLVSEETLSGANWFFWIAALTMVNSLIILAGFDWAFVLGLAVTLMFDVGASFASEAGGSTGFTGFHFFALVIDVIAVSIFCLLGYFARKGAGWAFIVGMILYGIDMLFCLLFLSFVGLAIHAFALYCIYRGYSDT